MTITLTQQENLRFTTVLVLSQQGKVRNLLNQLEQSFIFNEEQKEIIQKYSNEIKESSEEKETMAYALFLILENAVLPLALSNDTSVLKWVIFFDNEIKERLAELLPNQNIEEFLEEARGFYNETLDEEKLKEIDASFARQMKELIQSANRSNAQLKEMFDRLKLRLQTSTAQKRAACTSINARMDDLISSTQEISTSLKTLQNNHK
jgi:hypothetical protein